MSEWDHWQRHGGSPNPSSGIEKHNYWEAGGNIDLTNNLGYSRQRCYGNRGKVKRIGATV